MTNFVIDSIYSPVLSVNNDSSPSPGLIVTLTGSQSMPIDTKPGSVNVNPKLNECSS
jgi:hypothetical protein